MKKAFVLYSDYYETWQHLTDEQLGKLTRAIFEYVNEGVILEPSNSLFFIFNPIRLQLERDALKYKEIQEKRAEAGKKGGRGNKIGKGNKAEKANALFVKQTKQKQASESKKSNIDTVTEIETDTETITENVIYIPSASLQVAPKTKPKGKHLFKNSEYFDIDKFTEAFKSTACFARHPNLDIELIYDMMVNSEAKGYMYIDWIKAAANWVSREPHKYTKSIKTAIQKDPAFALMTKGDIARAEHEAKMELQRKLLNNGNDPYSY